MSRPKSGFTAIHQRRPPETKGPRHDGLCCQDRDWPSTGYCYCLCKHCWVWAIPGKRGSCICSGCPCGGWRNASALGVFSLNAENPDHIRG